MTFKGKEFNNIYEVEGKKAILSQGVKNYCDITNSYWLIDIILGYQINLKDHHEIQHWYMNKRVDKKDTIYSIICVSKKRGVLVTHDLMPGVINEKSHFFFKFLNNRVYLPTEKNFK